MTAVPYGGGQAPSDEESRSCGAFVTGVALQSDEPGTMVSVVDGQTSLTDGPFAEVTDLLSGTFVIDFDSKEEALGFAARIPAARNGTVEVRRVLDIDAG